MPEKRVKISDILKSLPIRHKLRVKDFDDGNIPVYSSETQNQGIKGHYSKAEFKIDTTKESLEQYIVFGDHTRSINVISTDFSVMDNVKVLVPKVDNIDLQYIRYAWQPLIPILGYARHWSVAKDVEISIPCDGDGVFDVEKQKQISQLFLQYEERKDILEKKIEELRDIEVEIPVNDDGIVYKDISICDLFEPKGGAMKYSKKWCNLHAGEYVVYSGSTKEIFATIDTYSYDGEYLTWVIDGLAGYIMKVKGKFNITCHRGILLPTDNCKNICLDYVKEVMEPVFRKRIRGRMGIDGKNEYTALKPIHIKNYNDTIPIPVKKDGTFDYDTQKKLAERYKELKEIKESVISAVEDLLSITIE